MYLIAIQEDCETWLALPEIRYDIIFIYLTTECLLLIQVEDFLELFDSHIGLYGQNRYTLDSLLLTVIPPFDCAIVEPTVDHCDLTGTKRLLSCLMSALKMRTGISTYMV